MRRLSIIEVRSKERFLGFIKSKKLVFIAFYSSFTEPAYLHHIRDLFLKKQHHFLYEKSTAYGVVNTQISPQVAEEAKVHETTLLAFTRGSEYKRVSGDVSKWQIQVFLEQVLKEVLEGSL